MRGVIAVSGVYRIPETDLTGTLGGDGEGAPCRPALPLRGGDKTEPPRSFLAAGPMTADVYRTVFGADAKLCAEASPVNHVRPGLPPFYPDRGQGLPTLDPSAEEFHRA